MNLLALYEKLERLVQRLPQSLQSPILREINPIKTLFLQQRPPRILLTGDRAASRTDLINSLFSAQVAQTSEDHVQSGTWQAFSRAGQGTLRVLDGRRPSTQALLQRALTEEPPDLILFLETPPRSDDSIASDVKHAHSLAEFVKQRHGSTPAVAAVGVGNPLGTPVTEISIHLADRLEELSAAGFKETIGGFVLSRGHDEISRLASALAAQLPAEAKLEWARLSGVKEVQRELAQVMVKSVTAISGAVGAEPIPLADFPILMSLQTSLVGAVMYISGRELNMKRGGEFLGAMGVNLGLGLALREGARAAAKLVPGFGSVVSGGVAAAGTYAIGKAAIAYFIDEVSLPDAQKLFRARKKTKSKEPHLLDDRTDRDL